MRTLVLLLMICLMPLRAWTGDAMGMAHTPASTPPHAQLASQHPHGDAHAHAHANQVDATAHACHDRSAERDTPHTPSHAAACGSCDICHSQIAADTPAEWRSPELGLALRAETRWTFDSAQAPPCFKPPRA